MESQRKNSTLELFSGKNLTPRNGIGGEAVLVLAASETCYNEHTVKIKTSVKFSELVRLLERNGFELVRAKGSIRYYGKQGVDKLIRIDYHGSREVPSGTCEAILKAAGLKQQDRK